MVPTRDLDSFESERTRLTALAYRMLGSVDAEDVVQEAWLRWQRLGDDGRAAIDRPAAWLTTAVTRLALDRLRAVQRQREHYVGPWLPEPVLDAPGPDESVEIAESLTLGFLTVLERLGPIERAVFLLVDVFGEPFADVAAIVGRSEVACRQAASRARHRVREERQRFHPDTGEARGLAEAFLTACVLGDLDGLHRVLADDVVLISDGGADVHAARRPVLGFDRVARLLTNLTRRLPADGMPELRLINGEPGLILWQADIAAVLVALEPGPAGVRTVRILNNPDKLRHLRP